MSYAIGIDIGGTKTAVGIYTLDCLPIDATSFPTEPQMGADSLVKRISEAVRDIADKGGFEGKPSFVGVACPGPLDLKEGRIVYIPTMGFKDIPIKKMLETELGVTVALENDANCAALAEAVSGAGKGFDNVVYITVSTGVGSGVVIGGKIYDGAASSAGEIGHLTVERDGIECACGKRGCLEKYASGTAIAEIATNRLGRAVDAKEVFALCRKGDKICCEVVEQAAEHLAFALGAVWQLVDPDIVVLGGSVTKDFDVLEPLLSAALEKYVQPMSTRQIRLTLAHHSGEQGILGAVYNAAT